MANIVYPNTFVASTVARASEVNANFTAITDQVNGNLEAANLANNAVTTVKIADANVTTAKIADANVTTAKIADANVTTAKIADSNVTNAKLAADSVTTAKIANAQVTTSKVADSAITPSKTNFFLGGNLSAIYGGRVLSAGTAASLPSGWTVSSPSSGVYNIVHGLGTLNVAAVVTTEQGLAPLAIYSVTDGNETNAITVTLFSLAGSPTSGDFSFILMSHS